MVYQLSCVIVRLFGLFYLIASVRFLDLFFLFMASGQGFALDRNFLSILTNLFICLLLIIKPSVALIGLVRKDTVESADVKSLASAFQSAGIALIGIYFLLSGLQGLTNLMILRAANSAGPAAALVEPTFFRDVTASACGLLLTLAAGRISNLITWLRELHPRPHETGDDKGGI